MALLASNPDFQSASRLAMLPAAQSPVHSHDVYQRMPSQQRAAFSRIMRHPQLSRIATGQASAMSMAQAPDHAEALGGPGLTRSPTSRQNLVGVPAVAIAAGASVSFAGVPYGDSFRATRFTISPITLAACGYPSTLAEWQVGERSQYAALTGEPLGTYVGGGEGGRLRFHKAASSTPIGATVTAALTCTFYGGFLGTTTGRRDRGLPPRANRKEDILPIAPQLIGPGASVTVQVTALREFWPSRVWLDDNASGFLGYGYIGPNALGQYGPLAGAASLLLSNIFIGADPQFMSANTAGAGIPYVPANMFSVNIDMPIDFDKLDINEPMQFAVYNGGTQSAYFGGKVLGYVDRRKDARSDDLSYEDAD